MLSCTAQFINGTGLVFNVAGTVLLLKFGLPNKIPVVYEVEWEKQEVSGARARYTLMSNIGLILILLGFCLQLLGNFL